MKLTSMNAWCKEQFGMSWSSWTDCSSNDKNIYFQTDMDSEVLMLSGYDGIVYKANGNDHRDSGMSVIDNVYIIGTRYHMTTKIGGEIL